MEKIEVEKGVQMSDGVGVSRKYPFADMVEVGDSFFVKAETAYERRKVAMSIGAAARRFRKGSGWRFKTKDVTEVLEDQGTQEFGKIVVHGVRRGVRCWRVA
jgi:hypothetical protein